MQMDAMNFVLARYDVTDILGAARSLLLLLDYSSTYSYYFIFDSHQFRLDTNLLL